MIQKPALSCVRLSALLRQPPAHGRAEWWFLCGVVVSGWAAVYSRSRFGWWNTCLSWVVKRCVSEDCLMQRVEVSKVLEGSTAGLPRFMLLPAVCLAAQDQHMGFAFGEAALCRVSAWARVWGQTGLAASERSRVREEKANSALAFSSTSSRQFREMIYYKKSIQHSVGGRN